MIQYSSQDDKVLIYATAMSTLAVIEIRHANEVSEYSITQAETTIGRSADNLVVLDDLQVSHYHALLKWSDGKLSITDLDSLYGTSLNGSRIEPNMESPLKDGDVVSIGKFILTVKLSTATEKAPVAMVETGSSGQTDTKTAAPAKRNKLPGFRVLLSITIAEVVLLGIVLAVRFLNPAAGYEQEVANDLAAYLVNVNESAIERVNSEIDEINSDLYTTEQKLLDLEQVLSWAFEWVDYQKNENKDAGTTWLIEVAPDSLHLFSNENYQVATLEGTVSPGGGFSSTIKITDLYDTTKAKRNWEEVKNELEFRKSSLEQRKQEKLKDGQQSVTVLKNVIDGWESWHIERINSTTYNISGPGLGWSDELTAGTWTYDTNTGEFTPIDHQSINLQKILEAEG